MKHRPRRLRANSSIRNLTKTLGISKDNLIYPMFIKNGNSEEIRSMPNILKYNLDDALREIETLHSKGLIAIAIFPVIPDEFKNSQASEALNPQNLYLKAIQVIKKNFPNLLIVSDLALDPYTDHGHDGIIKSGKLDNDLSVEILSQMSLLQAQAGADILAPSDMMDGRIGAIRDSLEANDYKEHIIMSYTAKYASCLYAPFREALASLGSNQIDSSIPQDKLTYQMDPRSSLQEALRELELDYQEGADIVMVKPASWYLDIIQEFSRRSLLPVSAYQVSGEYSMICHAANSGFIDLDKAIEESLLGIKRAGATMILTYFAKHWLLNQKN